jgi:hypothetical protein
MQTHGEGLGIFSAKLRERSTGYEIIGQGGDGVDHGYERGAEITVLHCPMVVLDRAQQN